MNQKRVTDTRKGSPASKEKKSALPRPGRSTAPINGHARRTSLGDITDATTEIGIQDHTVQESVASAQAAKINAIIDIMHAIPPHDADTLAKVLKHARLNAMRHILHQLDYDEKTHSESVSWTRCLSVAPRSCLRKVNTTVSWHPLIDQPRYGSIVLLTSPAKSGIHRSQTLYS